MKKLMTFLLMASLLSVVNCSKSKLVVEKFGTGKIEAKYYVLKSGLLDSSGSPLKHGSYKKWHSNGNLALDGSYLNGKKNGLFTSWHENGKTREKVQFVDDMKEGVDICWFDDGVKKRTGCYIKGKRTGKWKVWNENGTPSISCEFNNGFLNGAAEGYDNDGVLYLETQFTDGRLQDWLHLYSNTGKLGSFHFKNNAIDDYKLNPLGSQKVIMEILDLDFQLFLINAGEDPDIDDFNEKMKVRRTITRD